MKTRNQIEFNNYAKKCKKFLRENRKKNFVALAGQGRVMLSVPHCVKQVRLGKVQEAETGTLALALALRDKTGAPIIAKTACFADDANFELLSPYRSELLSMVESEKIRYLFDLHGLRETCEQDINFGVNFGVNIAADEKFFDFINKQFKKKGLKVFVDQPFAGSGNTISSFTAKVCNIWTIQLEVNNKFLITPEFSDQFFEIVDVLVTAIEKKNKEPETKKEK
jgi:hypothetical protein